MVVEQNGTRLVLNIWTQTEFRGGIKSISLKEELIN